MLWFIFWLLVGCVAYWVLKQRLVIHPDAPLDIVDWRVMWGSLWVVLGALLVYG